MACNQLVFHDVPNKSHCQMSAIQVYLYYVPDMWHCHTRINYIFSKLHTFMIFDRAKRDLFDNSEVSSALLCEYECFFDDSILIVALINRNSPIVIKFSSLSFNCQEIIEMRMYVRCQFDAKYLVKWHFSATGAATISAAATSTSSTCGSYLQVGGKSDLDEI